MISANKEQQELLLEVSKLDLALTRIDTELKSIESNSAVESLRSDLLETSESLLQAHAKQEDIENEIRKVTDDRSMVEARIKHDEKLAREVASEREQKAVAGELASLSARKSALEDQELGLLEELETAKQLVSERTQMRTKLNVDLETALSKQHGEALTLSAQSSEIAEKRQTAFKQINAELQELYARKAKRGIAVSQTLGRDCSACRLSINAVEFEAIMAEPQDHIPTCPNCDALIIR